MNFRYKFSIVLICLGLVAAIMSFRDPQRSGTSARDILNILLNEGNVYNADQVAKFVIEEDSGIQFVDIRPFEEFQKQSIPGALNIPFKDLLNPSNVSSLNNKSLKTILYEDNDRISTQAWILAMQTGYRNTYILKGGLAIWDSIVMLSAFKGDKITPHENAIFEIRYKARRLFREWNAMPDSLKAGFYAAKQKKEKELVGGCE
jgi:rhodanese-related sulfurtransferase